MGVTAATINDIVRAQPARSGSPGGTRARIDSVDLIRGVVMILMALDHVRVFSGLPAGGPTPGIFFTRWVTHFCAPAFVFFAGTGAFLHGRKLESRSDLSKFLLTRAAWLLLLEFTFNRVAWTFNLDFYAYNQLNVIWAIACSMIVLAALIHLPLAAIATFGIAVIAGHNIIDPRIPQVSIALQRANPVIAALLQVLYFGGEFQLGTNGPHVFVLYSLIPWIGVMAAGYASGAVLLLPPERRKRICLSIGLGAIAAFLVLRGFNLYGNPRPWNGPGIKAPPLLSFLNTNKYPASLLFLLMTLGPCIALLPFLENLRRRVAGWIRVFGQVPLFYYLLHIPLIHIVAIGIAAVRTPGAMWWLFMNHPVAPPPAPPGYVYSLPLLWSVWILVVVALYLPCRWYATVKARRKNKWLSYL